MSEDPQPAESATMSSSLGRWASTAWLAGIPVAVAGIRLFVMAQGDPQTFLALVGALNVVAFFASSVEALASMWAVIALPLFYICYSVMRSTDPVGLRKNTLRAFTEPARFKRAVVLMVVLAVLFGPWPLAAGLPVAIGCLYLVCLVLDRPLMESGEVTDGRPIDRATIKRVLVHTRRIAKGMLVALAIWATFIMSTSGRSWFPLELIEIEGEKQASGGYVLGVEDASLTLLYLDGGVRRVPTGDVADRFVCPTDSPALAGRRSEYFPSLFELLLRRAPSYVPERCDQTNVRWR